MDANTGLIHRLAEDVAAARIESEKRRLIPLSEHDARTAGPMSRGRRKNWMRNKPCICGSGRTLKPAPEGEQS